MREYTYTDYEARASERYEELLDEGLDHRQAAKRTFAQYPALTAAFFAWKAGVE